MSCTSHINPRCVLSYRLGASDEMATWLSGLGVRLSDQQSKLHPDSTARATELISYGWTGTRSSEVMEKGFLAADLRCVRRRSLALRDSRADTNNVCISHINELTTARLGTKMLLPDTNTKQSLTTKCSVCAYNCYSDSNKNEEPRLFLYAHIQHAALFFFVSIPPFSFQT